jgi:hypothetical protein
MIRKLIDSILKGGNSSTVRLGGLFAAIWAAVSQSQYLTDLLADNPEYAAILGGIQAVIMIIQRYRTKEPVDDKPRLFVDKK